MNTSLRLALVIVTLSFLATLAWLATGDKTDWSVASHTLLARIEAALAAPENESQANHAGDIASGSPVESPSSSKPDRDRLVLQTADASSSTIEHAQMLTTSPPVKQTGLEPTVRQAHFPNATPRRTRSGLPEENPSDQPGATDIQLTGGNAADEPTTLRRTDNGIDLIVRNKDVTYVFEMLNRTEGTKIIALPSVKGPITITLYDIPADQALDAILKMRGYLSRKKDGYTLVYTQEDLEELDAEDGKIEVYIYKPHYIAATELMNILTTHMSDKGKMSSTKANQMGIAASGDNAGGDSLAVDDAIVVQDMHAAILKIKRIIEDVDVRPQQVLIEAVLLKVELKDDHRLGVNFALLSGGNNPVALSVSGNGSIINGAAGFPPSTLLSAAGKVQGAFAANEHGLKYGIVRNDITGFINLLETIGHTTVVASPKVLALNKQRAEIIVGSQLGYRTVTTTETAAVENVQFLDVGTQLRMRPFIQPNGYIRMELHPEKSNGRVSETTGLPEKDTTQVTTNLTIKSCETIVIGGLIEEQQQRSVQQVPFLGSLPWVGRLFRDETTSIARNEIIVLITPRIIDDEQESANASEEVERFSQRRDSLERSMPMYTRIALARKYCDRAQACRDAGDLKNARKMVELALYFDPMNEPALKLWEELQSLKEDDNSLQIPAETPVELLPEPDQRGAEWNSGP